MIGTYEQTSKEPGSPLAGRYTVVPYPNSIPVATLPMPMAFLVGMTRNAAPRK